MNTRRAPGAPTLLPSAADDGRRLAAPRIPGLITALGRAHRPDGPDGQDGEHAPDGQDGAGEEVWRAVLPAAELRRADAFRFAADRRQFQYARWLLRTELSRLAPVPPRDWEFVRARHGKPAIHPRFGLDYEFSLSHSGGLCLIALAPGRPLGVDIQHCAALDPAEGVGRLAAKCLTPGELAGLERLTGRARRDAVVQLWTLKEAHAKAVGLGLRLPFRGIDVGRDGRGGFALRRTARVPDPGRWACHAPPAPAGFRIGLCVARPAAAR